METRQIILNDADNYIKNMSNTDLIARNMPSNLEYLLRASNGALSFTAAEKKELRLLVKQAIVMLQLNSKLHNPFRLSIKFSKIDNIYENGYPHTRYNIIFLSPSFFENENKLDIIKHEYIHIYQRYNPLKTEKYLNANGFKKIGNFKLLYPDMYMLRRSNSDIDDNIWQDANGKLMFPIFSSNNPKSLNDVLDKKMEHPYEWMAYHLETS